MKKIMKKIGQILTGIAAAVTIFAGRAMATSIQDTTTAAEEEQGYVLSARTGAEAARAEGMPASLIGENGIITNLTNIALYIVSIISIAMLIYGGIRYIVSGGDNKKITDAKNTILYAIIGLIIALLSYAIVNFVLNAIGSFSA